MRRIRDDEIMILFLVMFLPYFWWANRRAVVLSLAGAQNNVFILAGQSNMAGRGGVIRSSWDGIVPAECRPNPAIIRFGASRTWEEAREPLHSDIDSNKTCGIGPGMAFANAVLDKDTSFGYVGLVPCAVGGTSITEWNRGGVLYSEMIRRANAAVEGGGGKLRAVLWFQGERDTISEEDATLYKDRLERLIGDLRDDLKLPELPVFVVALASSQGPYKAAVREAQLKLKIPKVIRVDANGLPLEPDGLHLVGIGGDKNMKIDNTRKKEKMTNTKETQDITWFGTTCLLHGRRTMNGFTNMKKITQRKTNS